MNLKASEWPIKWRQSGRAHTVDKQNLGRKKLPRWEVERENKFQQQNRPLNDLQNEDTSDRARTVDKKNLTRKNCSDVERENILQQQNRPHQKAEQPTKRKPSGRARSVAKKNLMRKKLLRWEIERENKLQ